MTAPKDSLFFALACLAEATRQSGNVKIMALHVACAGGHIAAAEAQLNEAKRLHAAQSAELVRLHDAEGAKP